jgi:hypothetical protein
MGLFSNLFSGSRTSQQTTIQVQSEERITPRVRGEFYEDKFFEDQKIKNQIQDKIGDGYFDEYIIGTILNVSKVAVENILRDCEEAVEHYSGEGNEGESEQETKSKAIFFKECVSLCKEQLTQIEEEECGTINENQRVSK